MTIDIAMMTRIGVSDTGARCSGSQIWNGGFLKTLIDPQWRLVSREDEDGDQNQAEQQSIQIFTTEEFTQQIYLRKLPVTTHAPFATFKAGDVDSGRQIDLLGFASIIQGEDTCAGNQQIFALLPGWLAGQVFDI